MRPAKEFPAACEHFDETSLLQNFLFPSNLCDAISKAEPPIEPHVYHTEIIPEPAAEQPTSGGQACIWGGQNLKLSTKAAVVKRVSLLIGGGGQACGLGAGPWPLLGASLESY